MTGRQIILTTVLFAAALAARGVTTNDAPTAEREGRELAQQLCDLRPDAGFTNSATLQLRGKSGRVEVPVTVITSVTETNWQSSYHSRATNSVASLTVWHAAGRPNVYQIEPGDLSGGPARQLLMSPFADSDFWVVDLAAEFFHWPGQRLWRKELKKGQSCAVLESRPAEPFTNGYSRVVSWIDIDTGGIVQAEAYDAKGRLLKDFEVKELEKVNGRLQVTEIQMRNVQSGSRTVLRFNFDQPN